MSSQTDVSVVLTEDQVLARTQGVRLQIVSEITKTNIIPDDPDQQKLLIKALDGLDKAALTTKRIKADESIAQGSAERDKSIIAALLSRVSHAYNTGSTTIVVEAPVLSHDEVPPPDLLPGEIEIGTKQLTYEDFMAENQRPGYY